MEEGNLNIHYNPNSYLTPLKPVRALYLDENKKEIKNEQPLFMDT
jgi:hypothetical protein